MVARTCQRFWIIALLLWPALSAADALTLPRDQGLPLLVNASVRFNDIAEIDDAEGSFTAEVDIRFRWKDARQAFPRGEFLVERREFADDAATAQLATMWQPQVVIKNLMGEPIKEQFGLYISYGGAIELIWRVTAKFSSPMDVTSFPFDRQRLPIELVCERYDSADLLLTYDQSDASFARVSPSVSVTNWDFGEVSFKTSSVPRWNHVKFPRLEVSARALRTPDNYFWPIFVPILAVIIIPILAIWLNKFEDFAFQIETFELVNMIVGGLFAIIALNFTVNSEYSALGSGDNTVIQLFGLSYLLIAIALLINIVLFKSKWVLEKLGKFVVGEIYAFLCWAIPVLTLGTIACLLYRVSP